jgi:hypothetical protein
VLSAVLLVLTGLAVGGGGFHTVPLWLAEGAFVGVMLLAAYVLVLRRQPSLIPIAGAAVVALGVLEEGLRMAFPAALPGAVAAVILILLAAVLWTMKLAPPGRAGSADPQPDEAVDRA